MRQQPNGSAEKAAIDAQSPSELGVASWGVHEEEPFRVFVLFLKRRGWIVGALLCIGLLFATIVNHVSSKFFTAKASIEIEADVSSQFRLEQVQGLADSMDTSERLDTEIEILRSRDLALETIRTLHLEGNPDFVPLINGKPWDLSKPEIRERLISNFLGIINVSRLGHTEIIQIFVTSRNPQLAALIANSLIDRYIEHTFRENYAATAKISDWLEEKLNGLKQNLERSQARILELQKEIGIFGLDQTHSVVAANLEELNKQYADAQVDRLLKESRLQAIKTSPSDVIDASVGASDPSMQAAMQRLSQLNDEYTTLLQTYGTAYPRAKTLKAEIDQLRHQIQLGEQTQIERSQKEFDVAATNEQKLLAALDKEEEEAYGSGAKAAQYELARRDYETNRLLYDGLQQRLEEASIMAGLHSTAIHTVDSADTPPFPSHPRTRLNTVVGAGVGFALGLALALLLETMDTNLKTMGDIEQSLGLPLLAAVPIVDAEFLQPSKFREHAVTPGASSWSKFAEGLRGLRTSILLSSPGAPPKVIMFASTRPAEGKSSMASLTAVTLALNGSKVLVIDADLRRPAVHLRFRIGKGLGLSSVLSGKATIKEAVVEWVDLPNVHILPSGPVPPLPSELLGSPQMESLLDESRTEYDFVILDTPPVLAVTDALIVGRLADATVLIVRYGTAQRQVVQRCIDLLYRAGAHLLGVAVNAVNYESPEYAEYYGRRYYEYYGERKSE